MSKKRPRTQSRKKVRSRPTRNPVVSPGLSEKGHLIEFGQELRRRRKELNMTLEQLAARAELTANYIGAIERGRRDPSLSTMLTLAHGLGIPAGVLLGSEHSFSPEALEFGMLFDSAPREIQEGQLMILRVAAKR